MSDSHERHPHNAVISTEGASRRSGETPVFIVGATKPSSSPRATPAPRAPSPPPSVPPAAVSEPHRNTHSDRTHTSHRQQPALKPPHSPRAISPPSTSR